MYRIEVYKINAKSKSLCYVSFSLVCAVEIRDETQVGFIVFKLFRRYPSCHFKILDLSFNREVNSLDNFETFLI